MSKVIYKIFIDFTYTIEKIRLESNKWKFKN